MLSTNNFNISTLPPLLPLAFPSPIPFCLPPRSKNSYGECDSNPRRTVLVARELARYNVDIAALSETCFSEPGQLEEVGAGYTFWSGRPKAE
ncbi:unnamed protein product [Schistocephalus solidus]|uniref:Uncharacterized protein n=1 Tax=Schistocephalus solidus TaxID=70667 RepID=A0A183T619_SCHSO|nr:unnamed protein product [Schistocephalus solidus]